MIKLVIHYEFSPSNAARLLFSMYFRAVHRSPFSFPSCKWKKGLFGPVLTGRAWGVSLGVHYIAFWLAQWIRLIWKSQTMPKRSQKLPGGSVDHLLLFSLENTYCRLLYELFNAPWKGVQRTHQLIQTQKRSSARPKELKSRALWENSCGFLVVYPPLECITSTY